MPLYLMTCCTSHRPLSVRTSLDSHQVAPNLPIIPESAAIATERCNALSFSAIVSRVWANMSRTTARDEQQSLWGRSQELPWT
jgi:hypothetical protein